MENNLKKKKNWFKVERKERKGNTKKKSPGVPRTQNKTSTNVLTICFLAIKYIFFQIKEKEMETKKEK